jgi:hypothetical protein
MYPYLASFAETLQLASLVLCTVLTFPAEYASERILFVELMSEDRRLGRNCLCFG